ncbi:MAG: hypothetical protein AAGC57_14470 [Pseudomonadota bacterium]
MAGFREAVNAVLKTDKPNGSISSLVDFLDSARQKVAQFVPPVAAGTAETVDAQLSGRRDHFDGCQCSLAIEGVCQGSLGDAIYLSEEDGGWCLSFLVELVEACVVASQRGYEAHALSGAEVIGERLRLANRLARDTDSTMPIDARFVPQSDGEPASLEIIWPLEPDRLVDAVLLLPHLLFHEIFVHGAQIALIGRCDMVDPECAFIEGMVGTVAYRVLTQKVIAKHAALPTLLKPLRWQFERQTHAYFGLRHGDEALSLPPIEGLSRSGLVLKAAEWTQARKIETAWRLGYHKIFEFFMSLPEPKNEDGDQYIRLILTLHLVLDREQRLSFASHICKLRDGVASDPGWTPDALFRVLNHFQRLRDPDKLLERLAWPGGCPTGRA